MRLRAARSAPRDEFVRSLSAHIAGNRGSRAWSRLAFAGAVSTLIVGMFASFGGLTYTASGASATYGLARNVVVEHKIAVTVRKSSAAAQYPGTPAGVLPGSKTRSSGHAAVVASAEARPLPFTGLSLVATVLVSIALIALGIALRRRERSES
jgi:hypothetical protein